VRMREFSNAGMLQSANPRMLEWDNYVQFQRCLKIKNGHIIARWAR
jgi:hypothetical protein